MDVLHESEWGKPYGIYACHVEGEDEPDNCVLVFGESERSSCPYAARRSSPDNCTFWRRARLKGEE